MKKIFLLFMISIFTLCLISCDFEGIEGPRDTWCERNIRVGEVDFICYLLYTEKGYTNSGLNEDAFENKSIAPGLTVVLSPLVDAGNFTINTYTKKHFSLGNQVEKNGEDDESPTKFNVGSALWNAIWICNSKTFTDNGTRINPPALLKSTGTFKASIDGLSWKDVVYAILEGI